MTDNPRYVTLMGGPRNGERVEAPANDDVLIVPEPLKPIIDLDPGELVGNVRVYRYVRMWGRFGKVAWVFDAEGAER